MQPAFGYEGDPMRLLFERGFAPTHAFSAFYRYLREDFGADVVLHFGTHGALEFMPGKQVGMSAACWPERLIGAMPNVYLYAANNPSEGAIAKRRSAATLVSYLTPSLAQAGLYRGLLDLKASLERWRARPRTRERRTRAARGTDPVAGGGDRSRGGGAAVGRDAADEIARLGAAILELEYTLIPHGLHVVGEPPAADERAETLRAIAEGAIGLLGRPRRRGRSAAGRRRRRDRGLRRAGDDGNARGLRRACSGSTACSPRTTRRRRCCARSTAASSRRSPAAT